MGKTDTGKANLAVVVLGAIASALTAWLKLRDYDGSLSIASCLSIIITKL